MGEMDEVVSEFLVESHENLDRLDQDFVALEKDPAARDRIASVFRTIHTIKGTCGFLGFSKLEGLAHVGENLLSRLRDGVLAMTPEITSALLAMVDAVRAILAAVEKTGKDGTDDYAALRERLTRLNVPAGAPAAKPAATPAATPAPAAAAPTPAPAAAATATPAPSATLASAPTPTPAAPAATAPAPVVAPAAAAETGHDDGGDANRPAEAKGGEHKAAAAAAGVAESNIRVDVGLLDRLMNLVGELVLARNQVLQHTARVKDPSFLSTSQRLNLITTELQEGVMKTRMQPIGNVWSKLPRAVRDLSLACQKKVRLEMEGKDTELDKTILEAIKDPLTHLVRNSVDHGIEPPAERVARGKPEEGTLLLRAYHEGGQVNIEIVDDGGGLRIDKIRKRALERGLITQDQASRMGERELGNLIFLPGFSTAEKVTNVSGRGVGMDVVKTNIEKIGGSIDLMSKSGVGMTIKIKIPLTLAIVPALIVTCDHDRYAIPQVSLLELVRLEGESALQGLEQIHGTPVYRLRGNLLPLVQLRQTLGLPARTGTEVVNIVVLQAEERQFGLVVDEILDTEEIVVKPLGAQLKGVAAFAGATIRGDGRVALILDVLGIAQMSSVLSGQKGDRGVADHGAADAVQAEQHQTLLLAEAGSLGRVAIPLAAVARLEEFTKAQVEHCGGAPVVQYRDDIMPLFDLTELLTGQSSGAITRPTLQVVVYSQGERSVGVVVDQIHDIVDEHVVIKRRGTRKGVQGSVVIQAKVAELLDLAALLSGVDTDVGELAAT